MAKWYAAGMMMVLNRSRRIKGVGRRLIVLIVAFSSLVTFFTTAVQLFLDYRQQRADLDAMLEQARLFLPQIEASVWTFDEQQITLALDAMVRLPHLQRAIVTTANGKATWTAAAGPAGDVVVRSWPLERLVRGERQRIGTLEVAGSLDGIYARVLGQAAAILLGNALKTFLVAGFMIVLFRQLISRRITELSQTVAGLYPLEVADEASSSLDGPGFPEPRDEIDALRLAFDNLERRLRLAVGDLHDRNAELQRLIGELSRVNVELERFSYVATHDLKEPVRALVSFSQLLERRYAEVLAGEGTEYLGFIIAEAKRLSDLVENLLAYSRSGRSSLRLAEVDVAAVVQAALQGVAATLDHAHAAVRVGPLPRLTADAAQLHQLFQHLLDNAAKFARPGEPPSIAVLAEREDRAWRFAVADNGIGIEAQYAAYVFEVFRRLNPRDAFPGTGIGLAIAKRVVEAHGGRIWLASTPGEGTTVFFTIPDLPAEASPSPVAPSRPRPI